MIRNIKGKTEFPTILFISGIVIFSVIIWLFNLLHNKPTEWTPLVACRNNMKYLGVAIQMYAGENSGSYPPPEKWCDLVTTDLGDLADKAFHCPAVKEYMYHYAMNPNCKPNSPPDTVLLFETQNSGWNLSGGPELLTTENHKEKVCNVLFNDGSVKGIKKEEIANLKWE